MYRYGTLRISNIAGRSCRVWFPSYFQTLLRQETVVTVQGVPLTSYMEGIIGEYLGSFGIYPYILRWGITDGTESNMTEWVGAPKIGKF